MQIISSKHARTAPSRLLKVILAAHVAHENQTLKRFDVHADGDHIHGHSNTRIIIVSERTDHPLRIIDRLGDFPAKLVSIAEFLSHDLNHIVRVAVSLGKNQRLGYLVAMRIKQREQVILETANDCANLAWIHNVLIKFRRLIIAILVQLLPALLPGQTVPAFDHLFHDMSAIFRNV